MPSIMRYSQFFKCNILLVDHLKPTTNRRLIVAFANKGNVAAGDIQYLAIAHDFVNPLIEAYFQGIISRIFFSLRKGEKITANAIAFSFIY
jgi:hypothetical protein